MTLHINLINPYTTRHILCEYDGINVSHAFVLKCLYGVVFSVGDIERFETVYS